MAVGTITEKSTALLEPTGYAAMRTVYLRPSIYGLLYTDTSNNYNAYIQTFAINNSGSIGAVLDTVRLNDAFGTTFSPDAIPVPGSDGIILFHIAGPTSGSIQTRQVSDAGILSGVIDSFTYADEDSFITHGTIVNIINNLYIAAYDSAGTQDGTAGTFTCDNLGNLSNGFIDTFEFAIQQAHWTKIFVQGRHADTNVVVFAYNEANTLLLNTVVKITDDGNFFSAPTVINRINIGNDVYQPCSTAVHEDNHIYVSAVHEGGSNDGWLYSWAVNTDGTIPAAGNPIEAYEYAPDKGTVNQIVHMGSGIVLHAFIDSDKDGKIQTWVIGTAGELPDTPLAVYEFADNTFMTDQSMILTEYSGIAVLAARFGGTVTLYTFETELPVLDRINISADAHIQGTNSESLLSDALIENIEILTITADAQIIPVWPPTEYTQLVSNAEIINADITTIASNAYIIRQGTSKHEMHSRLRQTYPATRQVDGGFQIF